MMVVFLRVEGFREVIKGFVRYICWRKCFLGFFFLFSMFFIVLWKYYIGIGKMKVFGFEFWEGVGSWVDILEVIYVGRFGVEVVVIFRVFVGGCILVVLVGKRFGIFSDIVVGIIGRWFFLRFVYIGLFY